MNLESDDPFKPQPPARYDIGRLLSHRQLLAGWQCRCCTNLLTRTAGGGLICLHCDIVMGAINT